MMRKLLSTLAAATLLTTTTKAHQIVVVDGPTPPTWTYDGTSLPVTYMGSGDGWIFYLPQASQISLGQFRIEESLGVGPRDTVTIYGFLGYIVYQRGFDYGGYATILQEGSNFEIGSVIADGEPLFMTVVDSPALPAPEAGATALLLTLSSLTLLGFRGRVQTHRA